MRTVVTSYALGTSCCMVDVTRCCESCWHAALTACSGAAALAATGLRTGDWSRVMRVAQAPSQEASPRSALQEGGEERRQQHERGCERAAAPCARLAHPQPQAQRQQRQWQVPACADLHSHKHLVPALQESLICTAVIRSRTGSPWIHAEEPFSWQGSAPKLAGHKTCTGDRSSRYLRTLREPL